MFSNCLDIKCVNCKSSFVSITLYQHTLKVSVSDIFSCKITTVLSDSKQFIRDFLCGAFFFVVVEVVLFNLFRAPVAFSFYIFNRLCELILHVFKETMCTCRGETVKLGVNCKRKNFAP